MNKLVYVSKKLKYIKCKYDLIKEILKKSKYRVSNYLMLKFN